MKKPFKILFFALALMCLSGSLCFPGSCEYYNNSIADDLNAASYLLVNTDTDTIMFSHNTDAVFPADSLTKLVTALVVCENCQDVNEQVVVSAEALNPLLGTYSTSCGLKEGEVISVNDLLYCMLLTSANDAANALAVHISGSPAAFAEKMNACVKALGCVSTQFFNPSGLNAPGQNTTAADMFLIAAEIAGDDYLIDLVGTEEYTVPATNMSEPRELKTTMYLNTTGSRFFYQYAVGMKTGFSEANGYSGVALCTKDGYNYIGVIMGCPSADYDGDGEKDNTALYELRRMFKWVLTNIKYVVVADSTTLITDVPVKLSSQADHIRLVPQNQVKALLISSVDESSFAYECYDIKENILAPVNKGDVLGRVKIKYAGNVIADVALVAGDSLTRNPILFVFYCVKTVFTSVVFYCIAGAGLLVFFVLRSVRKKSARKKKE